jgi:hypothetical protein
MLYLLCRSCAVVVDVSRAVSLGVGPPTNMFDDMLLGRGMYGNVWQRTEQRAHHISAQTVPA